MSVILCTLAAFALGMLATYPLEWGLRLLARRYRERAERLRLECIELIHRHQRAFPGRCPVCAFHRWGLDRGFEPPGSAVPPHDGCPERN